MKTAEKIKKLDPLVGTWLIEGSNLSSAPNSPDTPVTGIWKVEVLEGGRFLESHWAYNFGSDKHVGISILGIAEDDSQLKIFSFDNGGFYRAYYLNIEGQTWNIVGDTERATMEFDENGKTYREFWEIKENGKWRPFCKRKGTKN